MLILYNVRLRCHVSVLIRTGHVVVSDVVAVAQDVRREKYKLYSLISCLSESSGQYGTSNGSHSC